MISYRQIDKSKFQDDNEYNTYFQQIQLFVNILFNHNTIKEMNFNTFHNGIIDKNLSNFVQEFLQIIIMMKLKIKLKKSDFKIDGKSKNNDNNDNDKKEDVFVQKHPRVVRSDSIMSVGHTQFGITKNTMT